MKLGVTTARLTTLLSSRSSDRVWKAHSHCVHCRGTQPSSQPQAVQPFLAAVHTRAHSRHVSKHDSKHGSKQDSKHGRKQDSKQDSKHFHISACLPIHNLSWGSEHQHLLQQLMQPRQWWPHLSGS